METITDFADQVAEVPKNNKTKVKKGVNRNVNKPIKPKEKSEAAKARDEARYMIS